MAHFMDICGPLMGSSSMTILYKSTNQFFFRFEPKKAQKSPKKGHIINQKVHSYIVSLESYLQRHLHSYSNKDIDHEEHSNTFSKSHASPCMGHKTEENA